MHPDLSSAFPAKNASEQSFSVPFREAGTYTLRISAEAASVFKKGTQRGRPLTPTVTVTLHESPPYLEGFNLVWIVAFLVFGVLLLHRWSFAQRQNASMSTWYDSANVPWGGSDD